MKYRAGTWFWAAVVVMVLLAPAARSGEALNPDAYPGMGAEELGQLRYALRFADQGLDDWSNMENDGQTGMTAHRYLLAFTAYYLAAEQYHKLPACPEFIRPRLDRLIAKMLQRPVWEFWAEVSQGVPTLEPGFNRPYPSEHDPVATRNIMYSGHLTHMAGLYETLYRDFKWSEPGAFTFEWSPDEKYVYDNHSLNRLLFDLMTSINPKHCIECEPNACFPECNQHPVLGFLLHDQAHGTGYYAAREPFMDFFVTKKLIDPASHITSGLYLVKQDVAVSNTDPRFKNLLDAVVTPLVSLRILSLDSGSADGWTGAFMHAWEPDYIERHYPYQRDRLLIEAGEQEARLGHTLFEPQLKYGFFAVYAAEVGDLETRDKLLKYADRKYDPVWENGALRYPYSPAKGCTNLVGQLIALARACSKNSLYTMHNQVFDDAHFAEPRVEGVDFPAVLLSRAIYDRANKALIVTTVPGSGSGGKTSFQVVNLDTEKSYRLTRDGQESQAITGAESSTIEVPLDGKHDFILMEN